MKKIIDGKRYDTETAKLVGSYDNGLPGNDLYYHKEELYQKRTGEFFMYGVGGAASSYSSWDGNCRRPGERIIPLTFPEAQKWAEKHLEVEDYENIFGEVDESDEEVRVHVKLPGDLAKRLTQYIAKTGLTQKQVVEAALRKYL
jgi:hypothetical protein